MVGLSPGFVVIAVTELGGGLLLVAGALTRFACSALILVMLVAMSRVPLANGFFLNWALTPGRGHGIEYNLVVVGALLCLALTGPGAFSLDHRRARSAEMDAAGRARLRGKL
jgi:putative oxidoreductase